MHNPPRYPEDQSVIGTHNNNPSGVGSKFDTNGNFLHFPGNTIICHLPRQNAFHDVLNSIYDVLVGCDLAHTYALLPPSSWHMTLFEGVCDQVRTEGFWPSDLSPNAPLDNCDRLFSNKPATFDLDCELPLQLKVSGWQPLINGIGLNLEPINQIHEDRMRDLRDRLSGLLSIRHPKHETYVFHVGIAYLIKYLTAPEKTALSAMLDKWLPQMPSEINLAAPEFCTFVDMFAFKRQFFLKNQPTKRG